MAFNGSGLFNIDSTGQPVIANTLIESADFNALTADLATGLSNAICKDGQTTVTANLPMAGYKHTGVGNASARTDYAAAGQVQDGKLNWVDGGGTADAITATYSPAITALVDGQLCCVRATAANATTTPTFAPNGLTARTIVKTGGAAMVAGDIVGDGHELLLRYDLSNTRWELLNPTYTPTSLGLVIGSAVQAYDADTLKADVADVLTAGFAATPYNAGTKSSGTFTPDEANGNFQYYTNGGAHTLAPPTNNCTMVIQVTNNGSSGTVTTSGFTKVTGATPSTTNGEDFIAYITKINGFSHLQWQALQ